MAGPSTTGTLGLDISDFDSAWHDAMADIGQLAPELKTATAALKLLERQFRGAAGGATVTAKQVDNQRKIVKTLTDELKQAKSEVKAFQDTQDKPDKKDGLLSKIEKIVAGGAILSFAHSLVTGGRDASELTKTLDAANDRMDRFSRGATDADRASRGMRGAFLDLVGAISSIPVVGQAFDILAAPLLAAARHNQDMIDYRNALNQTAVGASELTAKLQILGQQRNKIEKQRDKDTVSDKALDAAGGVLGIPTLSKLKGVITGTSNEDRDKENAQAILEIDKAREATLDKISESLDLESRARSSNIAGSQKAADLAGIEFEFRKRIQQAQDSSKDKDGNVIPSLIPAAKLAMEQATRDRDSQVQNTEREYTILTDTLKVQDKISVNALRSSLGQLDSAKEIYELAERTYNLSGGKGEEQRRVEKLKMDQAKVAYRQSEIAYGEEITSLRLQTQATEAHFKGMQGVAEQAEIVAKFDKEIATQLRAGNKEAVGLLQKQKEIALIQAKAREHDVSPKDRLKAIRDERIERTKAHQQDARENALRAQAHHEGAGGGLDKVGKEGLDALRKKVPAGFGPGAVGLGGGNGALKTGGLERRDANGNIINGGLNAPIPRSRRILEQQLKDRNANEGKMRQAQALADQKAFQAQMVQIVGDLSTCAGALGGDK